MLNVSADLYLAIGYVVLMVTVAAGGDAFNRWRRRREGW